MNKVLTVRQPWASAIINGGKDVENRSWRTGYRGWLWIHAGKRIDHDAPTILFDIVTLPAGALIGAVNIVDCIQDDNRSQWAQPGKFHWLLRSPQQLMTPIPYRGQMGLFTLPSAVHAAALSLLLVDIQMS